MNSDYDDYRAVFAAKGQLTAFAGSSFPELLRDWNIANLLCRSSGLYGYKGEISVTVSYINDTSDNPAYTAGSVRNMLPGECFYAKVSSSYTLADTTGIDAAGINTSTAAIDTSGTSYTGNVLMVYNTGASDSAETSVTGTLPSAVASVNGLNNSARPVIAPKKYPVDRVLKFNGTKYYK